MSTSDIDEDLRHEKMEAEIGRIYAETEKIQAETEKINAERRYYPVTITAAITMAVVALIGAINTFS